MFCNFCLLTYCTPLIVLFLVSFAFDEWDHLNFQSVKKKIKTNNENKSKKMKKGDILATATDVTLAIGSALSTGVQGIILKKVDITQKESNSDAWYAASSLLATYDYLKYDLQFGAGYGAIVISNDTDSNSHWSVVATTNNLIIIGLNINCNGYNPELCQKSLFFFSD